MAKDAKHGEQRGQIIWLTGLPCAGKTTLAQVLGYMIEESIVLDGDDFRKQFHPDLGFTREDRRTNILLAGHMARYLADQNYTIICAFVSPMRSVRQEVRQIAEPIPFIEVWVRCSPAVCARRDVKGDWLRAARGEIENFTGFSAPYQTPDNPEVVVATDEDTVTECIDKILQKVDLERHHAVTR